MAEYIERSKLMDHIELNAREYEESYDAWQILGDVEDFPAADVVAVVRCKDCRNSMLWRKPTDTVIGECLIRKMNSEDEEFCQVGADDFCSYGERRDDNAR